MTTQIAFEGKHRHPSRGDRTLGIALTAAVLAVALAGLPPDSALAEETSGRRAEHVWLDASGDPLVFQDNAAIEAYLKTAEVVSREEIGIGINKMDKLLLEQDGVRVHAIFRDVDVEKKQAYVGDRYYMRFKDSYAAECAAYALAGLLGMDNVPPTVLRTLDRQRGSMQVWVENVRDPDGDDFRPPSVLQWVEQTWDMVFFDSLILNVDRNSGNMLVGDHYRLWLIDHTRAFEPVTELLTPERVQRVSRRVWERLGALSDDELADAVRPYLDPGQIAALLDRRKLMVEHVEALIQKMGRGVALH